MFYGTSYRYQRGTYCRHHRFPHDYIVPRTHSVDKLAVAVYGLTHSLSQLHPPKLVPLCHESMHGTLLRLGNIFKTRFYMKGNLQRPSTLLQS